MDTVGDMIIRLKNAGMVGKPSVSVPVSNLKLAIAEKLKERGFVREVIKRGKKRTFDIELAYYDDGAPRIADVKRISKPGRRLYMKSSECKSVHGGRGLAILSTPKGILTGDEARKASVGGEILFNVW